MALNFDAGVSRLVARVAGVRCVSAGSSLGGRTMQSRCDRTRLLMRRGPRRTRCASSPAPFHATHRPTRSRLVDEATATALLCRLEHVKMMEMSFIYIRVGKRAMLWTSPGDGGTRAMTER